MAKIGGTKCDLHKGHDVGRCNREDRPLSAYFNSFARGGFVVSAILEPFPPEDVDEAYRSAWKYPRYLVGLVQSIGGAGRSG